MLQDLLHFDTFKAVSLAFLKVCIANPSERSRFIKCIYNLLNSSSNAVRYEAAGTLVTLSSAPTAVKVIMSLFLFVFICFCNHFVCYFIIFSIYNIFPQQSYVRYKNCQRIKFQTINFGENILGQI